MKTPSEWHLPLRGVASALAGAALTVSDMVSVIRYEACPDEALPGLVGFPFAYRTTIPWVNSFSAVLLVKGLILNVLFWTTVVAVLWNMANKGLPPRSRDHHWSRHLLWGGTALCGAVLVGASLLEWGVQWDWYHPFRCPEHRWVFLYYLQ